MRGKDPKQPQVPTGRRLLNDKRLVVMLSERDEAMLQAYCKKKGIACSTFARDVILNELWKLIGEETPKIF